ncbi:hypothetical protein [Dactylosporangium sp. NPDC048998]|uniref:hypothetical protein n=1 Tax=Dactylosporangium sp. NPDC048998 TaxID=3363976 RepID=UPI00371AA3FB
MRDGPGLLQPLMIDELPPSKVDLRRAVRAGRRRKRARAATAAGLTCVAVLAAVTVVNRAFVAAGPPQRPAATTSATPFEVQPPVTGYATAPATPGVSCVVGDETVLGVDATSAGTFVFDPTGRVGVGRQTVGDHAFGDYLRSVGGRVEHVAPQGDTGEVIAVGTNGDFVTRNGRYSGGKFTPLPTVKSANSHGDVISDGEVGPAGGELRSLQTPPGYAAVAIAINEDGIVAGYVNRKVGELSDSAPVVWDRTGRLLRQLPVPADARSLLMTDITGDWVLARGVRWNLKTGAIDVIDDIWARFVDTQGRVYGDQPQLSPPHPGYWANGKAGVLPVDGREWVGMISAVSDDGSRIVGRIGVEATGEWRAAVWSCR